MGSRRHAVAVLVVALVVSACGFLPAGAGPTIVEGTFVDPAGVPLPDAVVTLSVSDWQAALDPGERVEVIYEVDTTTDATGRFRFAGPPPPEVLAFADGAGVLDIDLFAIDPRSGALSSWSLSREMDGAQWVGEAPVIELEALVP